MTEPAKEYFWGCQLSKENPEFTWSFDEEEDDKDYLIHTLFLKQAVLGGSAVKDERNLIQVETKNFDNKDLKHPLFSLTLGKNDMCNLDVSFGHENPVVFRLVEGTGPVHLSAQQLVEFPEEMNNSQDESELECTETEESQEDEDEIESPKKEVVKTKKRKASTQKLDKKSKQKGKMEVEEDSDEEEDDDEDEDMESDEEDEEDADSSPEKVDRKKGKKGKASPVKEGKKGSKAVKKGKKLKK